MKNFKYPRFLYPSWLFQLHFGNSEADPAACPLIVNVLLSRSNKGWISFFWCHEVHSQFYKASWHFYWRGIEDVWKKDAITIFRMSRNGQCVLKINLTNMGVSTTEIQQTNDFSCWPPRSIVSQKYFPPPYVMVSKSCRLHILTVKEVREL